MPRPDFESIARRYKEEFDPDDPFGRSSLTPEKYAAWKTAMYARQLDEKCPGWRDGLYRQKVEQKALTEWLGDDCTALPFILRGEEYTEEHIQLFLAIPWYTVQSYIEVFGDSMTPEWYGRFQLFVEKHTNAVTHVIEQSVDQLAEGELRRVAWDFYRDVLDFRLSYGEI